MKAHTLSRYEYAEDQSPVRAPTWPANLSHDYPNHEERMRDYERRAVEWNRLDREERARMTRLRYGARTAAGGDQIQRLRSRMAEAGLMQEMPGDCEIEREHGMISEDEARVAMFHHMYHKRAPYICPWKRLAWAILRSSDYRLGAADQALLAKWKG